MIYYRTIHLNDIFLLTNITPINLITIIIKKAGIKSDITCSRFWIGPAGSKVLNTRVSLILARHGVLLSIYQLWLWIDSCAHHGCSFPGLWLWQLILKLSVSLWFLLPFSNSESTSFLVLNPFLLKILSDALSHVYPKQTLIWRFAWKWFIKEVVPRETMKGVMVVELGKRRSQVRVQF